MPRNLDAISFEASQHDVVRPVILAVLDFASGVVRVTSAPYDLEVDGALYLGVGTLGQISGVSEGAELQSSAIQLTLSGIPKEMLVLALADEYQGRSAEISMLFLNDQHQIEGLPILLFKGRMDTIDLELGETATLTLSVQNRLADWERPRLRRYTHEDQQADFPEDLGLSFVAQMAEKTIYWGR